MGWGTANQQKWLEGFSSDFYSGNIWANYNDQTAEVTLALNGGLIRESPQNSLNSRFGIILICPGIYASSEITGESMTETQG